MQASLARIAPAIDPAATAIRDLERLSGGATQEIWRFALVGAAAPTIKILRRAPHGATGEGTGIGLEVEAELILAAGALGVPVPSVD